MNWIRENWFWIAVAVLFVWMHTKMHGGHGHHQHTREAGPDNRRREEDRHAQH